MTSRRGFLGSLLALATATIPGIRGKPALSLSLPIDASDDLVFAYAKAVCNLPPDRKIYVHYDADAWAPKVMRVLSVSPCQVTVTRL